MATRSRMVHPQAAVEPLLLPVAVASTSAPIWHRAPRCPCERKLPSGEPCYSRVSRVLGETSIGRKRVATGFTDGPT